MKEIYHNDHFHIRTDEQQEIINLICDNFPSTGFPRHILLLDDVIGISSHLGYMSIGYKHSEYEFEYGRKSNRICFYKKTDFKLIYKQDLKYTINSILKVDDRILIGTGVWGQPSGGELFEYNLKNNNLKTCTGESNAISFVLNNENHVEVYSFFQTGAYEGENRIYKLDKNTDFKIDYKTDKYDRIISDEEHEEMYNKMESTVTIDNIKNVLSK